jgi:hypothetical protein
MEHFLGENAGIVLQTIVILFGIGVAWGLTNGTIKNHGIRLTKVEGAMEQMQNVMVVMARYEERYNSMDQRVLAQGKRLDDTTQSVNARVDGVVTLINGRLEAINNIVSGHTAQLNNMSRASKAG